MKEEPTLEMPRRMYPEKRVQFSRDGVSLRLHPEPWLPADKTNLSRYRGWDYHRDQIAPYLREPLPSELS
jgi:hypothetical protein